jgi:hypothetical protein
MSAERPSEERQIQQEPTYPAALPALDIQAGTPNLTSPNGDGPPVRQPAVVTKLQILLRAHQVLLRAERWRSQTRAWLLLAAVACSAALGVGVYALVYEQLYERPERHTQHYTDVWGSNHTYYVKGRQVSQQEYDYFLQTNSNRSEAGARATAAGVAAGFGLGVVLCGLCWWLTRRKSPGAYADLEEQINSIVRGHPAAVQEWGGPAVLRQPELVAEVLRIEKRNAEG